VQAYADRFIEDGFAAWTIVLASERRVVGWGGLNRDPKAPQWGIEVAYFIDPAYWRRGLATELVEDSLAHAFADLGLREVGAFVRPENHASIRVLTKAGLVRVGFVPELQRDRFHISAVQWWALRHKRAAAGAGRAAE
jgi:ribosomal-protein-alanine N-acetyltransferase